MTHRLRDRVIVQTTHGPRQGTIIERTYGNRRDGRCLYTVRPEETWRKLLSFGRTRVKFSGEDEWKQCFSYICHRGTKSKPIPGPHLVSAS